jgi:hypothetical protein
MTPELLFQSFSFAGPLVSLLAILAGRFNRNPQLTRVAAIVFIQCVSALLYSRFAMAATVTGQPFFFYIASTGVVTYAILRQPAGRWQAIIGGITFSGFLCSLIYGMRTLWAGPSYNSDMFYWFMMFGMGCAEILLLIGWANAENGRRASIYCRAALAGLFGRNVKASVE